MVKKMSKFLKVQCDCGNEFVTFGDSKTQVNCPKCGNVCLKPSGGRAEVGCRILEVL